MGAVRHKAAGDVRFVAGDGRHEFGSFFLSRLPGMKASDQEEACVVSGIDLIVPKGRKLTSKYLKYNKLIEI